MATYSIPLLNVPAQTFSVQLGTNVFRIKLQWMTRFSCFRVDITTGAGVAITLGRLLSTGVNLLSAVYPIPSADYGVLMLSGSDPTPDNLGVDNALLWTSP